MAMESELYGTRPGTKRATSGTGRPEPDSRSEGLDVLSPRSVGATAQVRSAVSNYTLKHGYASISTPPPINVLPERS